MAAAGGDRSGEICRVIVNSRSGPAVSVRSRAVAGLRFVLGVLLLLDSDHS